MQMKADNSQYKESNIINIYYVHYIYYYIINLFQRAYFRNCSRKMSFIFYFGTNKE